ncbi:MAG: hypothetical protein LBJ41_10005 [Treponema sp.]|jgi:hypothetical protein|nr:hypothetical protein [Treponema sp.]
MNATAIRGELKDYIDAIPDGNLEMVRPILSFLARTASADEPLVIETDLTDEERAVIKEGRRERAEHPENFIPWTEVRSG